MSFLQGLTSGQSVAQGWLDTYEKSRKRKEAADLKTQREGILTAQPEFSQGYTAAQGQQLADYSNTGAYDVTPQYGPAAEGRPQGAFTGYQVAPKVGLDLQGDVPAAPMMVNPQRSANFLGGRVEGDLSPERMELMRSRALANTIADPMERQRALVQLDENERAARRAAQVEELTGLQISGARTTAQRESEAATREQANRTAVLQVGQMLQTGGNIDIPSLYKVASETGADPTVLVKTAADFLNITEKSAKATTDKLLRDIDAASVSPTKFNTLLKNSFDPDPNDNLSPELRPAAGGGFQVFYGDKPMTQVFKDTKDMPALSQLASFYRDRLSGNPLATAVQIEALNAKRASADKDRAYAGALDRRGTEEKGLAKKVQDAEAFLGRKMTEPEKLQYLGLAPKPRATAEVRDADVISLSKELVNKPTGLMVNGKPTKYTQQTAITAARQMLEQQTAAADPVDALISSMKQNTPATTQRATPAGQQLIGLSNALLPPVNPPLPAPTTSAERLRQLSLGQPRQQ